MVKNHLDTLINNIWKQLFSVTIYKKGPATRVTSKSKILYIMVLIDFKYKIARGRESCQWKIYCKFIAQGVAVAQIFAFRTSDLIWIFCLQYLKLSRPARHDWLLLLHPNGRFSFAGRMYSITMNLKNSGVRDLYYLL